MSRRPGDSGITVTPRTYSNAVREPAPVSVTIWGRAGRARTRCGTRPMYSSHHAACGGGELGSEYSAEAVSGECRRAAVPACRSDFRADSWEHPGRGRTTAPVAPGVECERVPFNPSIEVRPTTNVGGIAEWPGRVAAGAADLGRRRKRSRRRTLKDTTLTLPAGYTVNPSAGSGLGSCSPNSSRLRRRRRCRAGVALNSRRSGRSKSSRPCWRRR